MKKCKKCGRILTKKLRYLKERKYAEEYKDGLCVKCWIKENEGFLKTARIVLFSCH